VSWLLRFNSESIAALMTWPFLLAQLLLVLVIFAARYLLES